MRIYVCRVETQNGRDILETRLLHTAGGAAAVKGVYGTSVLRMQYMVAKTTTTLTFVYARLSSPPRMSIFLSDLVLTGVS